MKDLHFFCETKDSKLAEFFGITFMFDSRLYVVNDPQVMIKRLKNQNDDDFVALYSLPLKIGMFHTGNFKPTNLDIPLQNLRRVWKETWA